MKGIFVLVLAVFFISLVSANLNEDIYAKFEKLEGKILPFSQFFPNLRINLYIEESVYGIEIEKRKTKELSEIALKKPDFDVYMNNSTAERLLKNPSLLKKELDEENLVYRAYGFSNKVKARIVRMFL
jgi:hypothetical protein